MYLHPDAKSKISHPQYFTQDRGIGAQNFGLRQALMPVYECLVITMDYKIKKAR